MSQFEFADKAFSVRAGVGARSRAEQLDLERRIGNDRDVDRDEPPVGARRRAVSIASRRTFRTASALRSHALAVIAQDGAELCCHVDFSLLRDSTARPCLLRIV